MKMFVKLENAEGCPVILDLAKVTSVVPSASEARRSIVYLEGGGCVEIAATSVRRLWRKLKAGASISG